jgi:hypothetical protein
MNFIGAEENFKHFVSVVSQKEPVTQNPTFLTTLNTTLLSPSPQPNSPSLAQVEDCDPTSETFPLSQQQSSLPNHFSPATLISLQGVCFCK